MSSTKVDLLLSSRVLLMLPLCVCDFFGSCLVMCFVGSLIIWKSYIAGEERTGPKVMKLFTCSTQMSMNFQLLIRTNMLKNKYCFCFQALS